MLGHGLSQCSRALRLACPPTSRRTSAMRLERGSSRGGFRPQSRKCGRRRPHWPRQRRRPRRRHRPKPTPSRKPHRRRFGFSHSLTRPSVSLRLPGFPYVCPCLTMSAHVSPCLTRRSRRLLKYRIARCVETEFFISDATLGPTVSPSFRAPSPRPWLRFVSNQLLSLLFVSASRKPARWVYTP